jgi:uncharacterized membrane-anchored protein YitT (DUF2179 family)
VGSDRFLVIVNQAFRIHDMIGPSNHAPGDPPSPGPSQADSGPWKPSPIRRAIREGWRYLLLLAGVLAFVVAVRGLILPNRILSGGVTGMSLLLNRLTGFPLGLAMALLNVPIFVLGVRYVGRAFALRSAAAVLATWLLADYAPVPAWTHDPLLAGVFGGLLAGVGTALAMKAGGSLGGFDILGVVVNRRFGLGVGEVLLALNGAMVVVAGLIGTPELAMYTLVAIYATGKTIDTLQSPRGRKAFLIMTRRPDRIRDRVLAQMNRGITVLRAEGAWSREEITALLCVVTRAELRELGDIVQDEDPDAFVVVLESSEVMGSFRNPTAAAYWRRLQEAKPRGTAGR